MITCLLWVGLVGPGLGVVAGEMGEGVDEVAGQLERLREQRREAAHRQRQIIYNNDGNEPVYYCKEATREDFLSVRTEGLQGSEVDTLFYCTWSSGFGLFTHDTKVGEVLTRTNGVLEKSKMAEFIAQGTDPLRMIVDWCKANGVEVFWSMRMNDIHDGGYDELIPRWKEEHPEYLFGAKDRKPTGVRDGRAWSGVDFGRSEVRERAFRFLQEVCENYDVDGIEMDFFRHPIFFMCHAWGQPCGQEELDQMTGLVRRVRKMTEAVGLRRGRPLLVSVRVPDAVGYCEAVGLDITRWLEEGLVDLLVPSGYFQLSPWEDFIELGHRYGAPVYPCLSESRISGDAGKQRNRLEVYRARALNAWRAGADGIYTFNLFWKPNHQVWRELGDPEALGKMDKVYYVTYRGPSYAEVYLRGGGGYIKVPTLCPERPVTVKAGEPQATVLRVGDDVLWGKDEGIMPELRLRLQVDKLPAAEELVVKLNGEALSGGVLADGWIEYRPDPALVKQGDNDIEMSVGAGSQAAPVVSDLALHVSYTKAP